MSTPKSSISVGFSMKYTIQLLWYHHLWKPPYRCFFTASCRIAGSILVPSQVPGVEGSTRCLQRMLRDFGSPILGLPENRLPNPSKSSKFSDSASISHIFRVKIAILWVPRCQTRLGPILSSISDMTQMTGWFLGALGARTNPFFRAREYQSKLWNPQIPMISSIIIFPLKSPSSGPSPSLRPTQILQATNFPKERNTSVGGCFWSTLRRCLRRHPRRPLVDMLQ